MNYLRNKKFMHFILWMIVFVFVVGIFFVFGMKSKGFEDHDPNLVARIGETIITYSDFNKTYQPALDKLYRAKEDTPNASEIKKLKDQVLERLVDEAILEQTGQKLGITVPDEELVGWLQRQNYFLDENGKFSKTKYYQMLQANQLTPEEFESSQRNQMLTQKIQSILFDGVLFNNNDLNEYAQFLNRDLKAAYVSLDLEAYEKQVSATEENLKDYYQSNKSQYDHPERAKVRHILIGLQGNESIQDQEKAKVSLEDYRKQILSKKASFEELAKKYSQDGGSKDRGGELGWVTRNSMGKDLKEFEDMVFKLKKSELSKPVKTKYGYHLVQLEDYEKEYKSSFTDVRSKVLTQYKKEKASQKILSLSEQLLDKLKQNEDIEKTANELGLASSTTAWFNRNGAIPGIKNSTDLSDELAGLHKKEWKGPLEADKKEYFLQIVETRDNSVDPQKLEKDLPEIKQRLISQRQQAWLKDFLENQRKKLRVKILMNG